METMKALTGRNKTGVARAKDRCEDMLRSNQEFAPTTQLDGSGLAEVRRAYGAEGEPLGTMPPPASVQQLGKTAAGAIKAGHPTLLADKLAARLAFERSGVRLYEGLIAKLEAKGGVPGGPTRAELEEIRQDELEHFALLHAAVERMGADPTAMTPSADVEATGARGLQALVLEPRTSFAQALEAMLLVELADNEMWDTLVKLADSVGEDELCAQFQLAAEQEREHLAKLRAWVAATPDAM